MADPAHVVLVHGAWLGAWCWRPVEDALAEVGMNTTAVELPGRPGNPLPIVEATLEKWVDHLESVVISVPGPRVVVGHSLAGAALTLLGERRPSLIERLVYVAAFLLRTNESAADVIRRDPETQIRGARRLANDLRSSGPDGSAFSAILCNDCSEEAKHLVQSKAVPEATAIARTRVAWTAERLGVIPRTYVVCERDQVISPMTQRRMIAAVGCDAVHSMDTGHSPFLSRPRELSQLIAMAAAQSVELR